MKTLGATVSLLVASVIAAIIFLSFNQIIAARKHVGHRTVSQTVSRTEDVIMGKKYVGRIRYHYFNDEFVSRDDTSTLPTERRTKECSDIIILGVGTAMSVDDYDEIAERIVVMQKKSNLVVVISDSNPGGILKNSSTKYAKLSNTIHNQMNSGVIPICTSHNLENNVVRYGIVSSQLQPQLQLNDMNFLIGGHSSSGEAALEAAQKGLYDFVPSGFVGFDPYDISKKTMNFDSPLLFPTLTWGFTDTTCFVRVKDAAEGAYQLSSSDSGRALYLIHNKHNGMTHCVFTDDGCRVGSFDVCPTNELFHWVHESVAKSIHFFLNALKDKSIPFIKENFDLPSTNSDRVSLFVSEDVARSDDGDTGIITESKDTINIGTKY